MVLPAAPSAIRPNFCRASASDYREPSLLRNYGVDVFAGSNIRPGTRGNNGMIQEGSSGSYSRTSGMKSSQKQRNRQPRPGVRRWFSEGEAVR